MTTRLLLDMVHHNPGEPPFQTQFLNPSVLAQLGYNGQVFKHLNCGVLFDSIGQDLFPAGSPERAWMDALRNNLREEICRAKSAGLKVLYHIDLFVLPAALVRSEADAILDSSGQISFAKLRTREIHRMLFAEMFRDFPEVDGLVVRTGETYLIDTPYHAGNGPVRFADTPVSGEKSLFQDLVNFLREEICVRHNRLLIYRTWDTHRDRFHASADYYLDVTRGVKPHPKLIFSIKHTQLDFFRRIPFNPALGQGDHPQIIEVQCQREFEGKGAHPNYVIKGVIEGFEENQGPGDCAVLFEIRALAAYTPGPVVGDGMVRTSKMNFGVS